ncbi:MAG: RNA polymerase sigma factor [Lachnospiraceae bacterium]|nr:RNA polymerase sigma factor [Lachnospiraceae bacterium]
MGKIDSKKKLIELMSLYKNLVFSLCLKMTGDYFAAEDITQETFISAYQHLKNLEDQSEKAWLCRIASNKCIDYLRSAKRREVVTSYEDLSQIEAVSRDGPLELYVASEVMQTFRDNCEGLPELYRTPAKLYFEDGLTAKEISERSGEPLKTVQSQIYRAKEMLKKKIRKEDLLT